MALILGMLSILKTSIYTPYRILLENDTHNLLVTIVLSFSLKTLLSSGD